MRYRLSGAIEDQPLFFLLENGPNPVGSAPEAAVHLPDATVSRNHAEITVRDDRIEVRDLGSKNGTFVGAHKISARRVYPGMSLTFGRIALALESVSDQDLQLGMRFADESASSVLGAASGHVDSTVGLRPVELFVAQYLRQLLDHAADDRGEQATAQACGQALLAVLPALSVEITAAGEPDIVVFSSRPQQTTKADSACVESPGGNYVLTVELPSPEMAEIYRPLVESVGSIMRLSTGRYRHDPPPRRDSRPQPPLPPEPATVVPAVQRIYSEAAKVALGDIGVLISGESGTGKEVLSRFIHAASQRGDGAFVALNCAALPSDLLEAELFGIERGVATGVDARPGKFELAHDGTLFLDEIGDMALSIQAKILRVLQEKEVFRLGAKCARRADCRIIAATNRDITGLLEGDRFRRDLYYRIATWVVELPPLRHRREDIANLAAYFLRKEAVKRGLTVKGITTGALEVLRVFHWPGNIRQLLNEIARAALFLEDGQGLEASHLDPEIAFSRAVPECGTLEESLAHFERLEILKTLQHCDNVATAAAKELGIGRSTLYRRMKALGIAPDA